MNPREALLNKIEGVLPRFVEWLDGPRHYQTFRGEGRDGTVFQLIDPDNAEEDAFKKLVVKQWKPEFLRRAEEATIQKQAHDASLFESTLFSVPEMIMVDRDRKHLVMEQVFGGTAYEEIAKKKRWISKSFANDIYSAFKALNKAGVIHNDAHMLNWMLEDLEIEKVASFGNKEVIVDGKIWIIDFGRATTGKNGEDWKRVHHDIKGKLVEI